MISIVAAVAISTWTVRAKLSSIENTSANLSRDVETVRKDVEAVKAETNQIKGMIKNLPCEEAFHHCQNGKKK